MLRKKIVIIGGGAAGLMAAERFCEDHEVTIYEKGKTLGRKFLVAGKGGFNLANEATKEKLIQQYSHSDFFAKALLQNDGTAMVAWLKGLGIPTFVGTSGRIFPEKGIKPIEVLNKIKNRLLENGVVFHFHHEFVGFDAVQKVVLKNEEKEFTPLTDYYSFALGGASWSVTGSDGKWLPAFEKIGIQTVPFESSNCGVNINWSTHFKTHHAGKPLKNIAISIGSMRMKGEATITENGLEGNAIYPLIKEVRRQLNEGIKPVLTLDFKPNNSVVQLLKKIANKQAKTKAYAQALNLDTTQMALLKSFSAKESFLNPVAFLNEVKHLQVPVESLRPIEEAISTVGGIALEEVNPDFSLKKFPHIFVIGEMLDWDAPTGGFLLQGCFAMAKSVGEF